MEDIIDIIVTETTNLIEITSQSTDEVIDVNIIDNREDITLNVTPTVVEININSLTGNFGVNWGEIGGSLSAQTDLNTALGLKADLVGGKVPSSQLPSYVDDVVEVATYSALPTTGETGKIYVVLDTNLIYRWSGSAYIEIKDSSAVWGAITGTLSSQTDLQNALNAKFNNPTGDSTQYLNGAGTPVTFPIAGQAGTLVREVRNTTGTTLTKGTVVYISGATGNKPTVSKALATGDSTSAQTFGLCQADIANNANGYVVCTGDIVGIDTSAISEGVQLYLSSTTAGTYTTTKQVAPAHLVYIGVVTRSHPTQGQIEVKIQNGYELDEIHDVLITSKANNDGLFYESSTSLWKNKSIAMVLGYSPEQPLTFNSPLSRSTNAVSIPAATSSANGYLTSTDWTTFNGKQTALSGTGFVKISGTTISYDNSTYLTTSAAASTYALDSAVVKLTGNQTIAGVKTFSDNLKLDGDFYIKQDSTFGVIAGYNAITADTGGFYLRTPTNTIYAYLAFNNLTTYQNFSFPNATGTLALTSDLSSYLPLSGGTLTGALSGTSVSLSSSVTTSGVYLTGMTSGTGALYYNSVANRVTVANYNASGIVVFEVGGGATALTLNANLSASFTSTLSATIGTFSNYISVGGTSGLTSYGTINIPTGEKMILNSYHGLELKTSGGVGSATPISIFNISSGGAATFSSSVSATQIAINNTTPQNKLDVRDNTDNSFNSAFVGEVNIGAFTGIQFGYGAASGNVYRKSALVYKRTGSNAEGEIHFLLNNTANNSNAGIADSKMVILGSGNVGIGTTAPERQLHVLNSAKIEAGIYFNNTLAGSGAFLWQEANESMRFGTNNAERMRITSGGNLLVAKTSDSGNAKLQVNGNFSFGDFGSVMAATSSNVSTSLVNVGNTTGTGIGCLYFVAWYNTTGGAQGTALLLVRGGSLTIVSISDGSGCAVVFSVNGVMLRANTTTGTVSMGVSQINI